MVGSSAQQPFGEDGAHLVLYDGVCGLCNRTVRFLLLHDHRRVFRYAALQNAVGQSLVEQSGRDPAELTSFYVVADYRASTRRVFTRSDAVLFVVRQLDWPWKAATVMRVVPKAVRDFAYDILARTRYRLFGRYDQCVIPTPEFRSRFLD